MSCLSPVPNSIILDSIATARINNFLTYKLPLLSSWIKVYQSNPRADDEVPGFTYTIGQFVLLANIISSTPAVSGFRVYFASYKRGDPNTDIFIPIRKDDHMTLIFAPTKLSADKINQDNTGEYYILDPTGINTNPINISSFANNDIQNFSWVRHYINFKLPLLSGVATRKPKNGETKSLWFDKRSITDWRDEIACWERNGETITHVNFALAAYDSEQVFYNTTPYDVDYQLTLVITIEPDDASKAGSLFAHYFNMESSKTFKERLALAAGGGKFDTGVPCPPAVCG